MRKASISSGFVRFEKIEKHTDFDKKKHTFFTKTRPFLCPKINIGPFMDQSP